MLEEMSERPGGVVGQGSLVAPACFWLHYGQTTAALAADRQICGLLLTCKHVAAFNGCFVWRRAALPLLCGMCLGFQAVSAGDMSA